MAYEVFVGLRHLKGRNRSKVVSILTMISILGVMLGVWALIVVLAVLSGFGQDLRKKIIESTPNMVVDRHQGEFVHPKRICKKLRQVPDVTGCSPFLSNEIMLATVNSTSSSGALLRGIVAGTPRIKQITKQMRSGKFSHLFAPHKIPKPPSYRPVKVDPFPLIQNDKKGDPFDLPSLRETIKKLRDARKKPASRPSKREAFPPPAQVDPPKPMRAKPPQPASQPSSRPVAAQKGTQAQGDDAADDGKDFALPFDKDEPDKPKKQKELPGILLGQELARTLNVTVGEVIRGVSPIGGTLTPMGPAPRVTRFRVAGIFYTGMYEYDTKFAFVTLESAQTLFKMEGIVTGLELSVKNLYKTGPVKKAVRRSLGGGPYRTRDWVEMNSQLFGALQMEKIAMFLILALIVLVASFNIVSTLTMVVLEKAEEIAILKSMGATRGSIMRIFMIEGIVIGMIGTALGLFLGWRTCIFLINHPIRMDQGIYYILNLPVQMNVSDFIAVAIASIAISFLATIYPALQAARLHPVEGLQHE